MLCAVEGQDAQCAPLGGWQVYVGTRGGSVGAVHRFESILLSQKYPYKAFYITHDDRYMQNVMERRSLKNSKCVQ